MLVLTTVYNAGDASTYSARLKHEIPDAGKGGQHLAEDVLADLNSTVDRTVQEGTLLLFPPRRPLPLLPHSDSVPHTHVCPLQYRKVPYKRCLAKAGEEGGGNKGAWV